MKLIDRSAECRLKAAARTAPISAIVLHWSGGLGDAAQVERTLYARGYGYHYVIDPRGVVTQLCAHDRVARHTSGLNERSIGICLVGLGFGPSRKKSAKWDMTFEPKRTFFLGKSRAMYAYPKEQLAALRALCTQICEAESIPFSVAENRRLSAPELNKFKGILGHFHQHLTKLDPGPFPLDFLREVCCS